MLKISLDWQGKNIECEVLGISYPIYENQKEFCIPGRIIEYRYLENLHEYLDEEFTWKVPNNQNVLFYVKPNEALDEWFKAYQVGDGFAPLKQNVVADGKIYVENDTVNRWKDIKCAVITEYNKTSDGQESCYVITSDY